MTTSLPPQTITYDGYTYTRVGPAAAHTVIPANDKAHYVSLGNKNALAADAVKRAHAAVGTTVASRRNHCLMWVREQYGLDARYGTAAEQWHAVDNAHQHGWYSPPVGVPVFWTGGSAGAGHVAISDGQGNVWSTDIGGAGTVTLVPIDRIREAWGLTYAGWTESLEGADVYDPANG